MCFRQRDLCHTQQGWMLKTQINIHGFHVCPGLRADTILCKTDLDFFDTTFIYRYD